MCSLFFVVYGFIIDVCLLCLVCCLLLVACCLCYLVSVVWCVCCSHFGVCCVLFDGCYSLRVVRRVSVDCFVFVCLLRVVLFFFGGVSIDIV